MCLDLAWQFEFHPFWNDPDIVINLMKFEVSCTSTCQSMVFLPGEFISMLLVLLKNRILSVLGIDLCLQLVALSSAFISQEKFSQSFPTR